MRPGERQSEGAGDAETRLAANSATAAVRGRRTELGVLTCLGWTRPRVFVTVLGEVTLIGLTAGILGALLSPPLATALGLHASLVRAALAIPVAMALALVAGAVPAWLAARAEPMAAVRPPVLGARRARQPSGITGLAVVNVLRTPGRTIVGAVSLGVGVTALTLLVAVTLAFRGAVVGTLLGNVVTVQVRGVDINTAPAAGRRADRQPGLAYRHRDPRPADQAAPREPDDGHHRHP